MKAAVWSRLRGLVCVISMRCAWTPLPRSQPWGRRADGHMDNQEIEMKYFRKSILAASLSADFWAVHGAAQSESRVVDINL